MRSAIGVLGVLGALLVAMLATACDDSGPATPATVASSIPSTTEATDECEEVAEDTLDLFEDLVDELGEVDAEEFRDPSTWSDDLLELRARGSELDRRAAAAGCDVAAIQAVVLEQAVGMEPEGPVAELLLDLLLPQPEG